ncbi:MAG: MATE family efflux transporter [Deltaproteobacteria bacterium]|jgi:putative MATE family efflux protein|nr:MATE family efflux transporter [Deltaproteobacteria bacterium]
MTEGPGDRYPKLAENGSYYGRILDLALPLIVANLVQQLYSMTDVFVMGRFQGSISLAAVGASIQLSFLLVFVFLGFSVGASIVAAQSFGAKNTEKLQLCVHTTIVISLGAGLFLTFAGVASATFLLRMVNVPEEVLPQASSYLKIHFLSMIPFMLFVMGSALLRGVGDTKTIMRALIASLIVKVCLVFSLAAFFGGGVKAAASATIFAQAAAAFVVIRKLLTTDGPHRLSLRSIAFHKPTFSAIIGIGLPAGLQSLVQYLANLYLQSQVFIFGPDVMAAMVTYFRLEGILYMPIEGFALAAATLSGQNLGAKRYDRIRGLMVRVSILSVCVTVVLSILMLYFRLEILSLFNPKNLAARQAGELFFLYIIPFYFLYAINQNFGGVIRGTGEATVPMVIILFCTCLARVVWISIVHDNLVLLCLTYPISWVLTITAFSIYYRCGSWLTRHERAA